MEKITQIHLGVSRYSSPLTRPTNWHFPDGSFHSIIAARHCDDWDKISGHEICSRSPSPPPPASPSHLDHAMAS